MRKLAVLLAFGILNVAVPASADHCTEGCEPPPEVMQESAGCDTDSQGALVRVRLHRVYYMARVVVTGTSACTPFTDGWYRHLARHFLRFGTVYSLANPDFWTVEIVSRSYPELAGSK